MNPTDHDDLPAEIDFSNGVSGKFHRPNSGCFGDSRISENAQDSVALAGQGNGAAECGAVQPALQTP